MKRKIVSILLAVSVILSFSSVFTYAADTERVTRTSTLKIDLYDEDISNEAEGWSWSKETRTLTLDNVNFETVNEPCLLVRAGINIQLVGDNTFTADLGDSGYAAIDSVEVSAGGYRYLNNPEFLGDKLTVNAGNGCAVNCGDMYNRADSLIINGYIKCRNFVAWEGNTEVNATRTDEGYCIKASERIALRDSGNVVLKPGNNAAMIVEETISKVGFTEGLQILDSASLTVHGGTSASDMGATGRADTTIDTDGTITLVDCPAGFVQRTGRFEYYSGKIISDLDRNSIIKLDTDSANAVKVGPADYASVRAAIKSIPENLGDYTEESVAVLQSAVDSVVYDLDVFEQDKVDGYAAAIEEAVESLEELSWFIRLFRAIGNFFTNIFNKIFGWIII